MPRGPALIEGMPAGAGRRSAGADSGKVNRLHALPKDAIVVTMPDGATVADPSSNTKKPMEPPRANFEEVYAAGERLAAKSISEQFYETKAALEQFGIYDFQRDKATIKIAQTYGFFRIIEQFQ